MLALPPQSPDLDNIRRQSASTPSIDRSSFGIRNQETDESTPLHLADRSLPPGFQRPSRIRARKLPRIWRQQGNRAIAFAAPRLAKCVGWKRFGQVSTGFGRNLGRTRAHVRPFVAEF